MANYQLDIPSDEFKQFQPYINIYSQGKVIVQEGDIHDNRIFLLRQGTVNVLRWIGDRQQILGTIEAVNFFGEMAVIAQKPRSASVIAVTDPVVVYAFEKLNLSAILANYKWSLMLIKRLITNLEQMNQDYEETQLKIERQQEMTRSMLGALLSMYNATRYDPATSESLAKAIPEIIKNHMQESNIDSIAPDNTLISRFHRQETISEELYVAAITPFNDKKVEKITLSTKSQKDDENTATLPTIKL